MAGARGRALFWVGAVLTLTGGLGRLAARRMMQENPELYMGAVVAGMFDTVSHLDPLERVTMFFAYYGLHLALAGAVLAFIGLTRRR